MILGRFVEALTRMLIARLKSVYASLLGTLSLRAGLIVPDRAAALMWRIREEAPISSSDRLDRLGSSRENQHPNHVRLSESEDVIDQCIHEETAERSVASTVSRRASMPASSGTRS